MTEDEMRVFEELIERDGGDRCSLCRTPFDKEKPSDTAYGYTEGGATAIVSRCCSGELAWVVCTGVYRPLDRRLTH
jgi:hypothetical protein